MDVGVGNAGGTELVRQQCRHPLRLAAIVNAWNFDRGLEQRAGLGLPRRFELRRKGSRVGRGRCCSRGEGKQQSKRRALHGHLHWKELRR